MLGLSALPPFFDFRGADLCLNEVRRGWDILERISHSHLASASANMPYKIEKSEGVAHTEVQRRILPTEVMDPPLADGAVGVVKLNTPVET